VESRGELRRRSIFALIELLLFFVSVGCLLVLFALHLHQNCDLFADVIDDGDAGQLSQLLALSLESLSLIQVDLKSFKFENGDLPRLTSGL